MLRSARGLWVGLTLVALAVGVFVVLFGLTLPAHREIALLGLPFLALAFLAGRLARSVGATGEGAAPGGGVPR
jgi:hypothetical protein